MSTVFSVRNTRGDALEVEVDWDWVGHLVHWRALVWSERGIERRFVGTAETSESLEFVVRKAVQEWLTRAARSEAE